MNTDIRVSVSFRGHRKRKRLEKLLGPGACGYLLDLWIAVAMSHPNGRLPGLDAVDLALEAGFEGDAQTFVQALLDCGFLERDEHGYCLHDWAEHQAWAVHAPERSLRAKHAAAARWKRKAGQLALDSVPIDVPGHDPRIEYDPRPEYDPRYDPIYDPPFEHESPPDPHSSQICGPHAPGNAPAPSPDPDPDPAPSAQTSSAEEGAAARSVFGLKREKPGCACPPCPQQELVALYHQTLPELPKVKLWTATRARLLRSLWRARFMAGKFADQASGVLYFRSYFEYVRQSPFLLGQTATRGDKSFCADLEWLLRPGSFAKVIEGRYHEREQG